MTPIVAAANAEQRSALAALVPSRHRDRLRCGVLLPELRLVGAWLDGRPVGAGLTAIDGARASGESLYVVPKLRGTGLGRALLAALEHECAAAGVEDLTALIPADPRFAAARGLLRASGWDEPVLRHRQFETGVGLRASPRLADAHRLPGYAVLTHDELRPRDRQALARVAADLAPGLDPLRDEDSVIPEASRYLRKGDRIVGWVVHRYFAAGVAVLPTAWIAPSERGGNLGASLGLLAIAAALDAGYAHVRFVVSVDNAPMLRIIERDVLPYGTTEVGLLESIRPLGGPPR